MPTASARNTAISETMWYRKLITVLAARAGGRCAPADNQAVLAARAGGRCAPADNQAVLAARAGGRCAPTNSCQQFLEEVDQVPHPGDDDAAEGQPHVGERQ